MKEKKMLKLRIGVVIAVLLCLGIIIFFASKRIEAALAGEMQKTLEDVATQNIIADRKSTRLNSSHSTSSRMPSSA